MVACFRSCASFPAKPGVMSVKEQILQSVRHLPDGVDYCDVSEEIVFLAAEREAERDIEAGRLVTNQQMKPRIAEWSGSGSGRSAHRGNHPLHRPPEPAGSVCIEACFDASPTEHENQQLAGCPRQPVA